MWLYTENLLPVGLCEDSNCFSSYYLPETYSFNLLKTQIPDIALITLRLNPES